jgi:integrase
VHHAFARGDAQLAGAHVFDILRLGGFSPAVRDDNQLRRFVSLVRRQSGEIAAFCAAADVAGYPGVADAVVLAIATGQRQGDLLALPALALAPDDEGGYRLHLKQSKRGARIQLPIPAGTAAAVRIAAAAVRRDQTNAVRADKKQSLITAALWNDSTGERWAPFTFRHVFADIRAATSKVCPSISDATYQDTRDTALTRLAEAGCTIPEICAVSGHSEQGALQVLKHYLALNSDMADSAVAKLLAHQEKKKRKEG